MCLELSVKVGKVFKSALFGDAHDGVICCVKRLGGSVEPILPQKQDKGLAGHLSEPAHEVVWAALAKSGSIRYADRLAVMSRDPLQYGSQPLGVCFFSWGQRLALRDQQC